MDQVPYRPQAARVGWHRRVAGAREWIRRGLADGTVGQRKKKLFPYEGHEYQRAARDTQEMKRQEQETTNEKNRQTMARNTTNEKKSTDNGKKQQRKTVTGSRRHAGRRRQ